MSVLRLVRQKYKSAIGSTDETDNRAIGSNGSPCFEELKVDFPDLEPHEVPVVLDMLRIQDMRLRGVVPDHYTASTTCHWCGPVPMFPGVPTLVEGCPWCFNRLQRLPIPKAPNIEVDDEKK